MVRLHHIVLGMAFASILYPVQALALPTPVGTAFTYQGQLKQGPSNANGTFDMQFSLWDALAGPTQVGSTICLDNVVATDGLFTASLDFGAGVFGTQARWLEIGVRADNTGGNCGAGAYTVLAPRQQLRPAPVALFAMGADGPNLTNLNANNLASGTVPSAVLSGAYANALNLSNAANTFTGSGAGLTNLSAANLTGTIGSGLLSGTYSNALTLSNASNSFTGTFSGSGAGLTSLNASNLASGTVADARLSSNVALLTDTQTFSGAKTFGVPASFTQVTGTAPFTVSSTTVVTNLDADLLDGLNSTVFGQLSAAQTWTGANTLSNAGNSFTGNGAGLTSLSAANLTGTIGSELVSGTYSNALTLSNASNSFTGNGAGLTGLNASNISTGTVGSSLLSGTYSNALTLSNAANSFTGSGAGLSNLNASSLASGTVADARLSSNVALLNATQTFSAGKTFSAAPSFTAAGSPFSVTSTTLVANLNADRLDSLDSSAFLQSISGISAGGHLTGTYPNPFIAGGVVLPAMINPIGASPGQSLVFTGATVVWGNPQAASLLLPYSGTGSNGNPNGALSITNTSSGYGVKGIHSASGNFGGLGGIDQGVFGRGSGGATSGVYGEHLASGNRGFLGSALNGLSGETSNPTHNGVLGTQFSATGIGAGVYGQSASTSGRGVFGDATAANFPTYGVYGRSASTSGCGVFGEATAANGNTYGGRFECASSFGWGVYAVGGAYGVYTFGELIGVYGVATNNSGYTYGGKFVGDSPDDGYGVHATGGRTGIYAASTATSDAGVGGFFQSASTSGYGVLAYAGGGSGTTHGVKGVSSSSLGRGVFGWAAAATGTNYGGRFESESTTGRGVYGLANATGAGDVPYGVRGQCSTLTSGFAVYAVGDSGASGTKLFRIDHPFDPENKYLLHYATESPFPQNFYSGNVVTDATGYAWVELPEYFEEINEDYKYQLTVIGTNFAQAIVAQEIAGNRFQIRTSAPGVKVSWRVEANRNDAYVRFKKPKDVVDKEGVERGTYQHPELYGQPPEKGMDYDAEQGARAERPAVPDASPR